MQSPEEDHVNGFIWVKERQGTPDYVPPEMACKANSQGLIPLFYKGDVWALGATGYEIMHSRRARFAENQAPHSQCSVKLTFLNQLNQSFNQFT